MEDIRLSSRIGETTLHAKLSDRMQMGVVCTTFHHPVSGANVVTTENSDWATNCPEYKVTAVQVGLAVAADPAALVSAGATGHIGHIGQGE
jgi:formate dehydrogenase major subunit